MGRVNNHGQTRPSPPPFGSFAHHVNACGPSPCRTYYSHEAEAMHGRASPKPEAEAGIIDALVKLKARHYLNRRRMETIYSCFTRCVRAARTNAPLTHEGKSMRDVPNAWLSSLIRYVLLRGSGWRARKMPPPRIIEWRDPVSGLWYSEKKALQILQDQAIASYDRKGQPRRPFNLRC